MARPMPLLAPLTTVTGVLLSTVLIAVSDLFQDHGNALAHADAHGAQRVAAAQRVQLVHGGGGQAGTGGTQRMAQRNGAPPLVDAAGILRKTPIPPPRPAPPGESFLHPSPLRPEKHPPQPP